MSMFKGPKAPPPPEAPPPPPERSNEEIQTMAEEQRKRFGSGQGGRNSFVTGGLGVPNDAYSAVTALLGGSAK